MKSQNTNQISPYGPTSRLYYVCSALVFIHFGMTLPLYSKWRPQTVYIFCLISYFICFMPTLVTFLWLPFFCVKCRWLSTLCYDNLGWFFLFLWPFMLKLFFAFSFLWTLVWPPLFFLRLLKAVFFLFFIIFANFGWLLPFFYDLHVVCEHLGFTVLWPLFFMTT